MGFSTGTILSRILTTAYRNSDNNQEIVICKHQANKNCFTNLFSLGTALFALQAVGNEKDFAIILFDEQSMHPSSVSFPVLRGKNFFHFFFYYLHSHHRQKPAQLFLQNINKLSFCVEKRQDHIILSCKIFTTVGFPSVRGLDRSDSRVVNRVMNVTQNKAIPVPFDSTSKVLSINCNTLRLKQQYFRRNNWMNKS